MRAEDFRTPAWKRLSQYVEERIDELRELNDTPSLSPDKTALIRGGIAELKKMGVNMEAVTQGKYADLYSPIRPFSPEERAKVYDEGIRSGGIVLGTRARDEAHAAELERDFNSYGGRDIRR